MSSGDVRVSLGDVDPCGSRQLGRRSAVCLASDRVVAGLADGALVALDGALDRAWRYESDDAAGSVVVLVPFDGGVLAGERGADGEVRFHDSDTGEVRWRYRTADDVGEPQQETRFFLPFVVDAATDGDRSFVAARRYERDDDGGRTFESVVYAFDSSGNVDWRYETDASPISIDVRETRRDSQAGRSEGQSRGLPDDRVAVGFNRCPGDHRDGLVVLDTDTGDERGRWDPPGDGDRRVGDVSLTAEGTVVASHADYRGYCLGRDGSVRWSVDLGRPVERDGETVYAYPNHVYATDEGAVFVTGNTYPEDGRETDARHPDEHTAVGIGPDGERRWAASVGGFTHGIGTADGRVAVPVAQHFRERDPDAHGAWLLDVSNGASEQVSIAGVATAAAVDDNRLVVVEEPVEYHDGGEHRGGYRLMVRQTI